MAQFTDAQLLENCRTGDAVAIEAWVNTYQQPVYRLALTILDDGSENGAAEADEAVQDVFLAALRALHTFRGEAKISTWLYAIALNICRGRLRKRRSRRRLQQALTALFHLHLQTTPPVDEIAFQRQERLAVWEAVRCLPDNQRLAVVLRYYHGLSLAEIARIAGLYRTHHPKLAARRPRATAPRLIRGGTMTALTHEQARRYLHLGTPELTPAEIADLVGHLAACHECRTYAARLEALRPELAAVLHTRWDTLHPPVGLPRTIARRARRDTMKRQTISYASAAVGVIALLVFFILFRFVIPRQSAHPNTTTIPQATMLSTQSPPTEVASSIPSPTFSAQPASSTPIFTPTPPPTPEPTDTLTPAPSITPSNTPAAMAICPSIKPIAQAPMLWGASFLPDGQWITYWAASQEAIAQAEYEMPVGVLHFINLQTGQACMRPEFTTEAGKPLLGWSVDGDGQVTVITDQGTYRGLPCQTEPFMQVSQQTKKEVIAASSTLPPDYSPDGKYQVKTESLSIENDIEKFDTTIIAVNSGEVVQHLTWLIDTGTGSYENVTGGMWISNSQFLIDRTFDRGPLIVDAAKGVIQVLTDLLGMQEIPSPVDGEFYIPWGIPLPGDKPDQYHLLVVGAWPEADSPTVSLYHAESGVVETLPYSQPWYGGFSPDHQWLMMDRHPDVNGYEAFEVWIRRLEDVDGKWQLLADPSIVEYSALWNSNYTEMVVNKEDRLTWQPFPDPNYGERLGCWQTTGYWTLPDAFSLDGCRVLATGNKPGEWDYGLFVLDRCQTIPKLPELSQTQDFTTLAEAQFAARFTLLAPSFVPEGLMLNKVSVNDYADGSQTVFIAYAEDFTGEKPDANVKGMLIRLTIGSSLITMDSLTSIFKETVLDILSVTVRGQVGYTYWMPAVAAGNSAWLAWNEGDLTITITLYGNWPQPTEDDPHGLDETLLQIAESLK